MTEKEKPSWNKHDLVKYIEEYAALTEENIDADSAWAAYNHREAVRLRHLALTVAETPDEVLRRLADDYPDLSDLDGELDMGAGIHPSAEPPPPPLEGLLEDEAYQRDEVRDDA